MTHAVPDFPVYFASVLLERNRWSPPPRQPTYRVSDWLPPLEEACYAGIELWENHWCLADAAERQRLAAASPPVRVFNTYLLPASASETELQELAATLAALPQVHGLKFNLGPRGESLEEGIEAALRWAEVLPVRVRLLCECHPGTILETPLAARAAFARWPTERFGAILHPLLNTEAVFCDWLAHLGSRIEHLHLQLLGEGATYLPFAAQADFVRRRVARLGSLGFHGTATIEFVAGTNSPAETPSSLWRQALADVAVVRGF